MVYGKCLGLGLVVLAALWASGPAAAMTLKECSARYQAAKADGSLGGRNWSAFRATDCAGAKDKASDPANEVAKPAVAGAETPAGPTAQAAFLPETIDPKYAAEKPSRARLHTCADAYRAAKKAGTLNGLRWIERGGGYYSQCSRKLKASGKG